MKHLELKLTGVQDLNRIIVSIDDKSVNFEKNKFKNLICNYQTDNNKVNIKVYKLLDVGKVGWFIIQLCFFVITIFGLFDIYRRERCLAIDFETEIELKQDSNITLKINSPRENARALDVETDLKHKESRNAYYLDTKAKKTLKTLLIVKICLAIVIVAAIIAILFVTLK